MLNAKDKLVIKRLYELATNDSLTNNESKQLLKTISIIIDLHDADKYYLHLINKYK